MERPTEHSESFRRKGFEVAVSQASGFLCKVQLKAVIDMPADEVFAVFTNPDNSKVFRQIDECCRHQVVRSENNVQEIQVEQASTVGFLWFKHRFVTSLTVIEDRNNKTCGFDLLKPGIMKDFKGFWTLTDIPPPANGVTGAPEAPQGQCLAYLEQDIAPAVATKVPGWFHGFLRRMCAHTVVEIIEDIQTVAALRHRGLAMHDILTTPVHGRGGLKDRYHVKTRAEPASVPPLDAVVLPPNFAMAPKFEPTAQASP